MGVKVKKIQSYGFQSYSVSHLYIQNFSTASHNFWLMN